jgi:hypothetical protein
MTTRLSIPLVLGLLALLANQVGAQSVVIGGVEYREITQLNQPRLASAQPQLGGTPRLAQYTPANVYAPSNTVWPARAPSAADQRPTLGAIGQPVGPRTATYAQPYAYGYGYANGCSWASPAGFANRVPAPSVVAATPYPVSQVQPLAPQTPYGGVVPLSFTNLPSGGTTPFNPYQPASPQVPLRPIVPIRSMPTNYEVGQGILGQPKVYVPGQPLRNMLRYITP